jgi:hypothetical protein
VFVAIVLKLELPVVWADAVAKPVVFVAIVLKLEFAVPCNAEVAAPEGSGKAAALTGTV